MKKAVLVSFLVLWIALSVVRSQNKFEKEERIDFKEVPGKAKAFFSELELDNKAKWYRESAITGFLTK
ncbi:MAG: hypothetical protein U5L09_04315 [Bacteroidales bacterium]|nr:hypothetical protein [Bacteroidales bacterium]